MSTALGLSKRCRPGCPAEAAHRRNEFGTIRLGSRELSRNHASRPERPQVTHAQAWIYCPGAEPRPRQHRNFHEDPTQICIQATPEVDLPNFAWGWEGDLAILGNAVSLRADGERPVQRGIVSRASPRSRG